MAIRADATEVRTLLKCAATVDLTTFIAIANTLVDDLLGSSSLSVNALKWIETYLAAHFYTLTEERGALASDSFGDATERYHNIYKAGLNATRFGQQAIVYDSTGTLARETAKAEKSQIQRAEFRTV